MNNPPKSSPESPAKEQPGEHPLPSDGTVHQGVAASQVSESARTDQRVGGNASRCTTPVNAALEMAKGLRECDPNVTPDTARLWMFDAAAMIEKLGQPKEETAWLIEAQHNGLIIWWRSGSPWGNYGEPNWTRDAFLAVRFQRAQDAQAVIDNWPEWMGRVVAKPTDHLFLPPPPERP